jgi:starch synthase
MAVSYSQLGITYDILREKLLWSTADRLLAVSQALRNDLVDSCGLDSNRIRIVYNGVDTEVFHPKPAPTSPLPLASLDKKIILYVGHFGLRKGLFFLIRAMKKVKKEVPDSHLICIGGVPKWLGKVDYWGILRNEVSLNDVEDSVTILDRVKQRELADYYVAARVFALPSYYESFPKAIVEAMACGLPVVATSSGGIPELVDDGVTGTLVPFGSVESLAKALVETLSDESHSRAMGLRGRQKVERMFTWKAVSERVKSAYEELDASDCRN